MSLFSSKVVSQGVNELRSWQTQKCLDGKNFFSLKEASIC